MQDKISPLTIGVKEACKITGLSESFIYQSCRREDELRLPHIKSGKRIRIITKEIPAWIDRCAKA